MRCSEERLAAIGAREKAASAGPWDAPSGMRIRAVPLDGRTLAVMAWADAEEHYRAEQVDADAAFLANSRQDVPDLLADLREARLDCARQPRADALLRYEQNGANAAIEQLRNAARARELALKWLRDRIAKSEQTALRLRSSYNHSSMRAACELLALLEDAQIMRCRELISTLEGS